MRQASRLASRSLEICQVVLSKRITIKKVQKHTLILAHRKVRNIQPWYASKCSCFRESLNLTQAFLDRRLAYPPITKLAIPTRDRQIQTSGLISSPPFLPKIDILSVWIPLHLSINPTRIFSNTPHYFFSTPAAVSFYPRCTAPAPDNPCAYERSSSRRLGAIPQSARRGR